MTDHGERPLPNRAQAGLWDGWPDLAGCRDSSVGGVDEEQRSVSRQPLLSRACLDLRAPWHVVVSAKSLDQAKSRLAQLGERERRALAAGMAEDVIDAVVCAQSVARVVVVCGDPVLNRMARAYGADVVPDPCNGLNAAFRHGMEAAAEEGARICLLAADLACLTPQLIDGVLARAARHESAVVPDLAETGTTMLTSGPWPVTRPQFGPGSFRRHVAAGAEPIAFDLLEARCDVDTPEDLRLALRLGVGRRTAAAALDGMRPAHGLQREAPWSE